MPDQNVSLSAWCSYHRLNKSTVWRRCQEMGIPVKGGLSPDAERILEMEFNVQKTSKFPEPEGKHISVEVGSHAMVLSDIGLPDQFSLETLRSGEAIEISDPLSVAVSLLNTAEILKTAMNQDIQNRMKKLHETRQARDAVASKTQELLLEARLYQLETSKVDAELTLETQKLAEDLGKLQQFARPAEPSPQSEPPSAS